jgi:hypothetical protein
MLLAAGISHIKYIHDYKNDELVAYFTKETGGLVEKI